MKLDGKFIDFLESTPRSWSGIVHNNFPEHNLQVEWFSIYIDNQLSITGRRDIINNISGLWRVSIIYKKLNIEDPIGCGKPFISFNVSDEEIELLQKIINEANSIQA